MTHKVALLITLLALTSCASAEKRGSQSDLQQFARSVLALKVPVSGTLAIMDACKKRSTPLPANVALLFEHWHRDNAEVLANIERWSARSDEIYAASDQIPLDVAKTQKQQTVNAVAAMVRLPIESAPRGEVNNICQDFASDLSTIKRSPMKDDFETVKRLERLAFPGAP
jgi:hypothetical protein